MGLSETLKKIIHQYPIDKKEEFKGAEVGHLVKNTAVEEIKKTIGSDEYLIKGSIGAGQFASIPWIAIMKNQLTHSTKEGVYIVFLFSADEQSVYLTLNQGVTYFDEKKYKRNVVQAASKKIYNAINEPKSKSIIINLHSDTPLGQGYEKTTISGYKYDVNHMPADDQIKEDMNNLISDYQQLITVFEESGETIDRFYESILGHSYAGDQYVQFKYLFESFVNQSQINLSENEGKATTLGKYYINDKNYNKMKRFDSVTVEKIDMHIHLFNSSHYGPKNGNGSGKVPYIDYQIKDKQWANIRTTFHDYKIISVRFVVWDENKEVDIDLEKSFDISKMELFSGEVPNDYFRLFYDEYMLIKEEAKDMSIDNTLVNDLSLKLLESKNIILRGAPGTGKSYLAKEIAANLIGVPKEELETSSQFEFVQFHPSYDYTDFVEGLRPIVSEDGTMGFELQSGVFKSFCRSAINAQEHGGQDNFEESYDSYLDYVNCSEEKEYLTNSGFVSVNSKRNLKVNYDSGNEGDIISREYLYELYKNENYSQKIYYRSNGLKVLIRLKEKFGLVDYTKPNLNQKDLSKKFVFVIDEINRGEISKIFGELFYSIDPGYRGELGSVKTQYSNMSSNNEKFYIPENVYIIGTMNDIDRSVDSFDFAMRRRFRFIEIKANESTDMLNELENKKEAIARMVRLNDEISKVEELNDNYHIGASYFLKLDALTFEELWEDYLEPLLADYIRGIFNEEEVMKSFKNAYDGNSSETGDMNDDTQDQG